MMKCLIQRHEKTFMFKIWLLLSLPLVENKWKWNWKSLSCVCIFETPWTIQYVEFSRPDYWSRKPFPSPGILLTGIEPRSPTLCVDSLPSEPPGKPKNRLVGSLSLLQWIFPTKESNWGLLHSRWILYQLSYQERPKINELETNQVWFIWVTWICKIYVTEIFYR